MLAKRKLVDAAICLPSCETSSKIGLHTGGSLVAFLGGLGEELHHDCRQRRRHACALLVGRHRLPRDVTVHPLHRIGCREGELPRQHFVEGDTQGIEIAAGVDRAVHPAGLFRRHVGERSSNHLRRRRGLMLARQTRGNAEARQPHAAACLVDQNICRLDVLMDQTSVMHLAERRRNRDRDAQERRYVQWPAKQSIERHAAGILKHQRHAVVVVCQRDWPRRPVSVKFSFERIFVFKPLDATKRRFFGGNKQDRRQAVAGAPVEGDVSLPQGRKRVARELTHEGLLPGGLLGTLIRLRLLSPVNPKQTLKCDRPVPYYGSTMKRTALAFCSTSRDAVEEVLFGMQCLTLGTTDLAVVLASSELAEITQTWRARVVWSSRFLKHQLPLPRLNDIAVMGQVIEHHGCHLGVAEHTGPFS